MEEQTLDFRNNDDPTLVVLDDKAKSEVMKEIKELHFASGELFNRLNDGSLERGFAETLMSLLEIHTVKIHKSLNYDSALKKDQEERHAKIRELNIQNHELRKQLGEKCSPEDVRECLKNMESKLRDWWRDEGMGHVSELTFHPYVCRVKLSGLMAFHEKENQDQYLKSKGFIIAEPERGHKELFHSEKNIELLIAEVTKRFPSAKLSKIELSDYRGLHIRDAEFVIKNYDDI